jgi:tetratricopeptide (TPR) repeat protein
MVGIGWQGKALTIGLTLSLLGAGVGLGLTPVAVQAQALAPERRDEFLSDPEFAEPRDPLLPTFPIVRPLSPLEKRDLAIALDQLAQEAEDLYDQGETEAAFDLWMREVRLRRILGYEPELEAIQRVGLRVWENSRTPEAQLLTLRLDQIQADVLAQPEPPLTLVIALASSYEVLRAVDEAIALYETLAVAAAQADNIPRRTQLLERVGQLQADWFRFAAAADTYRQLLVLADSSGAAVGTRIRYLRSAIANYESAEDRATAITYQRRLLRQYEQLGERTEIPPIQLAIARNYRALDRPDLALPFYKAAYSLALTLDQSLYARDVVADLASIYQALERPEDVLYLYDQQLAVERLSYSGYGIMVVFDQLGQFYETQGDFAAAIAAYREGLILAHHLNHRRAYFATRIRHVQIQQGTLTITPADHHVPDGAVDDLVAPFIWQGNAP